MAGRMAHTMMDGLVGWCGAEKIADCYRGLEQALLLQAIAPIPLIRSSQYQRLNLKFQLI
ncbi:hypothetical protein CYJ37_06675 [Bacillus sp. UMB0728]|nr:hypothetical protein CYJ37_06675 [Bacillus sp. UMB0728]